VNNVRGLGQTRQFCSQRYLDDSHEFEDPPYCGESWQKQDIADRDSSMTLCGDFHLVANTCAVVSLASDSWSVNQTFQ
jgi:hypothetical protein